MKQYLFLTVLFIAITSVSANAQHDVVPHVDVPGDVIHITEGQAKYGGTITTPPDFPVRTMAEWEEIQSLVIAWTSFPEILKQIAFHAKAECEVIILAQNPSSVTNYLNANNAGGAAFDNLDNITILDEDFDSIWGRDYGAHTIYREDVGDLMLVDWIYNRNRPADDDVPEAIAQHIGVPLYATTEPPYDLMATGGNWMSDGLGTAFSSELIIEENSGGTTWWGEDFPNHSSDDIEDILEEFMGIERYIQMERLPFDVIHHIDMHMKLLDEETILMGQYPDGVADGPQIEANLEYVLSNYQSAFGTPYDVVRIQMPPEGGSYPNTNGDYRTYTNLVFVNKTVLVPIYQPIYDEPALQILQNELPGYNVVGIECNDIIGLSGAIHCITKAVGVDDPMLIVHDHLDDTDDTVNDYEAVASIQHASNIASATLYYRVDGGTYNPLTMTQTSVPDNEWTAYIPAQAIGAVIDYYVDATANSGKQQVRPIVAPLGSWTFEVTGLPSSITELNAEELQIELYPNPASAITVFKFDAPASDNMEVTLEDMTGRVLQFIHQGSIASGAQRFFFDVSQIPAGAYLISLKFEDSTISTSKLMVR
jgi:agmatine deiminase